MKQINHYIDSVFYKQYDLLEEVLESESVLIPIGDGLTLARVM